MNGEGTLLGTVARTWSRPVPGRVESHPVHVYGIESCHSHVPFMTLERTKSGPTPSKVEKQVNY